MTVAAPPRPPQGDETEALIEEARRRARRHRWYALCKTALSPARHCPSPEVIERCEVRPHEETPALTERKNLLARRSRDRVISPRREGGKPPGPDPDGSGSSAAASQQYRYYGASYPSSIALPMKALP